MPQAFETYKFTKTFIAGKEGFLIFFQNAPGDTLMSYIEHKGRVYFISTNKLVYDYWLGCPYNKYHDLIISTFKLLDK